MKLEPVGNVVVLRMQGPKANAMGAEMLGQLLALLDLALEGDASAIVLTGHERFFSAGLALPELLGRSREDMRGFLDLFSAVMLRVFTADRPVVAAINGHAIAGGCVLALQCDVRLAAEGDFKIGLNEVQLGIGLPCAVIEPLRYVVPASAVVPIALEGKLFVPTEAKALGLVDELVVASQLENQAVTRAEQLGAIPRAAFHQTKRALRRPAVEAMARVAEGEREAWLDTWFSPVAQSRMFVAVKKLTASS